MIKFNFKELPGLTETPNSRNQAAIAQLQKMIDLQKSFNLSFYTKDGQAKIWIEETGLHGIKLEGFSVTISNVAQINNLLNYLYSGKPLNWYQEDDNDTEALEPETFQFDAFKGIANTGLKINVKPEFLTRNTDLVFATINLIKGCIFFKLNRTDEVVEFIENPQSSH